MGTSLTLKENKHHGEIRFNIGDVVMFTESGMEHSGIITKINEKKGIFEVNNGQYSFSGEEYILNSIKKGRPIDSFEITKNETTKKNKFFKKK